MSTGEGSSSDDQQRRAALLKEIQITDEHPKKLKRYSFEQVLALNEERLKSIFGAEDGILYSMNLKEIRKKHKASGKSLLSSPNLILSEFLSLMYNILLDETGEPSSKKKRGQFFDRMSTYNIIEDERKGDRLKLLEKFCNQKDIKEFTLRVC